MKNITPNLFERAIAAVSPSWALSRHKTRMAMAMSGGYAGAGYRENLSNWTPGFGDADNDAIADLPMLRSRSRDLVRNSPIAGGAIETDVAHVVGTGLTLQSRIDAKRLGMTPEAASEWQSNVEREFMLWAGSEFADAYGESNFYELQNLAYRSAQESGDSFVVLVAKNRPSWPYRMALQVIEADRVCNPDGRSDNDKLVAGIERDESGEVKAVHIASRHPGSSLFRDGRPIVWSRVPFRGDSSGRRNVLHLKRKLRPGQTRGIPALAPIIETLKQLTRYSQAEVDAAVNSAAFAVFTTMDPDAFKEVFSDDGQAQYVENAQRWDGSLGTAKAVNLLPGESIETANMARPNPNFDPFVAAVMRQVGMGLNIPFEVLVKHFSSSYSAARAALLDAWRTFKIRREWLASKMCQPVYEEWLADAVATGRIAAPGFFADPGVRAAWCRAMWAGDGPGAIDPLKEASAAEKRMQIGLSTLAEEITAYDGGDWDTKHAQQVLERKARERDGLAASVSAPAAPAAPAAGRPPERDDGEDGEEDDGQ